MDETFDYFVNLRYPGHTFYLTKTPKYGGNVQLGMESKIPLLCSKIRSMAGLESKPINLTYLMQN